MARPSWALALSRMRRLGDVTLEVYDIPYGERNIWGATEVLGSHIHGLQPGPVTRIAPGAQIRLVDDEGREVSRGEVGEYLVRGPYLTVGYWVAPDRIDPATRDGW